MSSIGPLLTMPLLVINMGGEMVYILEQRLHAQSIPKEKCRKVLTDVVRTMYSAKFIAELFKPQHMYSNRSTRQIFDRLAHSSIMRLNQNSMDKLYDLMTMGFKYQILCSTEPSHILQVTLNHLEAMKKIVDNRAVGDLIESASALCIGTYSELSPGNFFSLKQTLCRFFQDRRVKVSLFLQDGIQNLDGTIVLDMRGPVPVGSVPPGTITTIDESGSAVATTTLDAVVVSGARPADKGDPLDPKDRPCHLGENMYLKDRKKDKTAPKVKPDAARHARGGTGDGAAGSDSSALLAEGKDAESNEKGTGGGTEEATAGLNLLASLLGTAATATAADSGSGAGDDEDDRGGPGTFKLQLFAEDPFTGGGGSGGREATSQVIMIDATDRETLSEMFSKLMDDENDTHGGGKDDEDADLLDLMDSAT